jgi:hypothetical protein
MKRLPMLLLGTSTIALLAVHSAAGFECRDGEQVTAGLGEGVTLESGHYVDGRAPARA